MKPTLLVAVVSAALAGCAGGPTDYGQYLANMPRSILVLPPIVNTGTPAGDEAATAAVLGTVTRPLAEHGYYVVPTTIALDMYRKENLPRPSAVDQPARDRIRSLFGADAALHVIVEMFQVERYQQASIHRVKFQLRLECLRTGALLWHGSRDGVAAASSMAFWRSELWNPEEMAFESTAKAFGALCTTQERSWWFTPVGEWNKDRGLLLGSRHPGYSEDQERMRRWQQDLAETRGR